MPAVLDSSGQLQELFERKNEDDRWRWKKMCSVASQGCSNISGPLAGDLALTETLGE